MPYFDNNKSFSDIKLRNTDVKVRKQVARTNLPTKSMKSVINGWRSFITLTRKSNDISENYPEDCYTQSPYKNSFISWQSTYLIKKSDSNKPKGPRRKTINTVKNIYNKEKNIPHPFAYLQHSGSSKKFAKRICQRSLAQTDEIENISKTFDDCSNKSSFLIKQISEK